MMRARSDEQGFTLIELLVVASIGLIVFGGATTLLVGTVRGESDQRDRSAQVQQARVALERLTREVRQGDAVATAEPSSFSLETWVKRGSCGGAPASSSIQCRVTYQCSGDSCTREETDPGVAATGSGAQVVEGLIDDTIFTYAPAADPTWIGIELKLGNPGEADSVTLSGGVALRNAVVG